MGKNLRLNLAAIKTFIFYDMVEKAFCVQVSKLAPGIEVRPKVSKSDTFIGIAKKKHRILMAVRTINLTLIKY
jgi:hypothetical protein